MFLRNQSFGIPGKIPTKQVSDPGINGNKTLCLFRFFLLDGSVIVSNGESVTQWLHGIKAGDSADIQRLWNRYFERLVRLAGAKLPGHCRRAFDEEDVAISAFQSFCDRAGQGQFPQLNGRDDLWRLTGDSHGAQGGPDDAPPESPEEGRGPGPRRIGVSGSR